MPSEEAVPPVAPDELLVERICSGDAQAFEELYERYLPRVYRFVARRVSNRADVDETVQEVFVNLFSSIHSFRHEAPFGAWVFGLTRRTVASRFKKRSVPTVPLDASEAERGPRSRPLHDTDPLAAYEYGERLDRLWRAVSDDLSEEQRQLFHLHHLEHRSIRDIATLLRKTENAVKSHLYRARKLLLTR
jgi:RNA polymerase sigma-70 factor (ECF subfamily)